METLEQKIAEFLNVPEEILTTVNAEVMVKMRAAVDDDNYFELHRLGYEVKK